MLPCRGVSEAGSWYDSHLQIGEEMARWSRKLQPLVYCTGGLQGWLLAGQQPRPDRHRCTDHDHKGQQESQATPRHQLGSQNWAAKSLLRQPCVSLMGAGPVLLYTVIQQSEPCCTSPRQCQVHTATVA